MMMMMMMMMIPDDGTITNFPGVGGEFVTIVIDDDDDDDDDNDRHVNVNVSVTPSGNEFGDSIKLDVTDDDDDDGSTSVVLGLRALLVTSIALPPALVTVHDNDDFVLILATFPSSTSRVDGSILPDTDDSIATFATSSSITDTCTDVFELRVLSKTVVVIVKVVLVAVLLLASTVILSPLLVVVHVIPSQVSLMVGLSSWQLHT